jgi:hypothetical protein
VTGGNFAVAHFDNGQYTGVRTGLTIAQFKTSVLDPSNWTFDNDGAAFGALSATSFTAVPEPHEYALLVGGLLATVVFMRRRQSLRA